MSDPKKKEEAWEKEVRKVTTKLVAPENRHTNTDKKQDESAPVTGEGQDKEE